jgi:hypothetical protein
MSFTIHGLPELGVHLSGVQHHSLISRMKLTYYPLNISPVHTSHEQVVHVEAYGALVAFPQ